MPKLPDELQVFAQHRAIRFFEREPIMARAWAQQKLSPTTVE